MILVDRRKEMPLIFRPAFKLTMMAACTVLGIAVLLWVPGLLSSFLLSVIFVFILSPAVDFFERHGITRSNSILIVFSLILCLFVVVGMMLSNLVMSEYGDLASRIDFYSSMINDEINRRLVELERRFGLDRFNMAERMLVKMKDVLSHTFAFSGETLNTLMTWLAVVPIMLYFFLQDGHHIRRALIGYLPNRYFEMSLNIQQKIANIVGSFIRAKLIESLIVGLCALAGFIVAGFFWEPLNYMFFMAIVVGVFNIIPYVGTIISSIPVLLVAVVQYVLLPQFPEFAGTTVPSWAPVMAIAATLVFAHIVDNVYLTPVLLGHSVDVHALIVLVSVIIGAKLLGITGMIISIPLASILQTLAFEISDGIKHLRH